MQKSVSVSFKGMDVELVRTYCLRLWASEESTPFGPNVLVYKLHGKIFALISIERPFSLSLKCEPEKAVYLREHNREIVAGYHLNKKHWNTIDLEGNLSDTMITEMIDHSYNLILAALPKKIRDLKQI